MNQPIFFGQILSFHLLSLFVLINDTGFIYIIEIEWNQDQREIEHVFSIYFIFYSPSRYPVRHNRDVEGRAQPKNG